MNVVVQQDTITTEAALVAARAALAKGRELGCSMVVAVVDASGNLIAFLRSNGAFLPSTQIAQNKAYTAAGFRTATETLVDRYAERAPQRQALSKADRVMFLPGGVPIVHQDKLIGAIGVSGGSGEQDVQCALAGVAALSEG